MTKHCCLQPGLGVASSRQRAGHHRVVRLERLLLVLCCTCRGALAAGQSKRPCHLVVFTLHDYARTADSLCQDLQATGLLYMKTGGKVERYFKSGCAPLRT